MNFTSDREKLINSYTKAEFILSCSKDISQCAKFVFNIIQKKIIKVNVISMISGHKFNKKNIIQFNFNNNLSCYRYIPNVNDTSLLFTDRFIMVNIPELSNRQNLATNPINDNSFTVFPDKVTGIIYYRGNPYYAVKIYQDNALGNITTLTFSFYDSWGNQIKLNTNCINVT